jgi:hypothetical protein
MRESCRSRTPAGSSPPIRGQQEDQPFVGFPVNPPCPAVRAMLPALRGLRETRGTTDRTSCFRQEDLPDSPRCKGTHSPQRALSPLFSGIWSFRRIKGTQDTPGTRIRLVERKDLGRDGIHSVHDQEGALGEDDRLPRASSAETRLIADESTRLLLMSCGRPSWERILRFSDSPTILPRPRGIIRSRVERGKRPRRARRSFSRRRPLSLAARKLL